MNRLNKQTTSMDLKIALLKKGYKAWKDLAPVLGVTPAAISKAINDDPQMKLLKDRIIEHLYNK